MSEALVRRYFDALARLDGEAMTRCLHPMVSYSDPVFADLRGDDVGWRWRLMARGAADMHLAYDIVWGDAHKAQVQWLARYRFAGSHRQVSNQVCTTLTFWDGTIVRQIDEYDFPRWSRSSAGVLAWAVCALPAGRAALRRRALLQLRAFIDRETAATKH